MFDEILNAGEKTKKIREILNLTQDELAGDSFNRSYISKLEKTGKISTALAKVIIETSNAK